MFIKFPEQFDEYINRNNIYGEILLNYDLPYYLDTRNTCYEMELNTEFFEGFPSKARKMLINIEHKWNENQGVALRDSTFSVGDSYGFRSSSIQVLIQVYEEEMEEISDLFQNVDIFQEVMQKSLELFIIKYNINMNGNHFVTPSASDCSMRFILLYKNWIQFKEDINGYISPNIVNKQQYNTKEHVYDNSLEIDVYKYFLNKARYSKRNFDYIDTIVSGAVALESFVYSVIRCFIDNEDDVDKYTFDEDKEKYYSVFQLIRKLIEDDYIINKNNITMSNLRTHVSNILSPRNDLMHGKLKSLEGLNARAKKSFESLTEIFENFDINISKDKTDVEKSSNEIIISHKRQCAKKIINESFNLHGYDRINKVKQAIKLDSELAISYLSIGNEYLKLKEIDKGIEYLKKALNYTFLKDEIYYNIGLAFVTKKDDCKALEVLKLVKDKPRKDSDGFCVNNYYLHLGECYLRISRDDGKLKNIKMSETRALELAIKSFNRMVESENYTYLKYRNLVVTYMDMNNFSKALKYINMIQETYDNNSEIILFKAYCYLNQNNIYECLVLVESILFESKHKEDISNILMYVYTTNKIYKEDALNLLNKIRI